MMMSYIWFGLVAVSLIVSLGTGTFPQMTSALFHGADSAVTLVLSLAGTLCFWSGIIRILEKTGISAWLSDLFSPLLRHIFPNSMQDPELAAALSGNFTANLLGLGNAATPLGLRAVARMRQLSGSANASNEMCRLVVMNTASIQLLPTTVAAVRSTLDSAHPFAILPAVWITSLCTVLVGLLACRLMEGLSHD